VVDQRVDAFALLGRHRKVGDGVEFGRGRQLRESAIASRPIGLVDHHDGLGGIQARGHPSISRSEGHRSIDHEDRNVDVGQSIDGRGIHPFTKCRDWFVQPRSVDEDDLSIGPREHTSNLTTSGLRLVGDDRHLASAHGVQQGRLADVRTTDQRDETGPHLS
jgi:hypothetical protein